MNTTPHMMLDLETMGTTPGSAIVSIGAVMFDPYGGWLGSTFYCRVDLQSCVDAGLKIDVKTIYWWLQQSEEVRAEAVGAYAFTLRAALNSLRVFMIKEKVSYFWSQGNNFDPPILEAAYAAIGEKPPWEYNRVRDTRTVYDMAGVRPDRSTGTAHNALSDAIAQAMAIQESYKRLGLSSAAIKADATGSAPGTMNTVDGYWDKALSSASQETSDKETGTGEESAMK